MVPRRTVEQTVELGATKSRKALPETGNFADSIFRDANFTELGRLTHGFLRAALMLQLSPNEIRPATNHSPEQ
jgi:hypothetical protein